MSSAKEIEASLNGIIGCNDEESTVSHYLDTGFAPLNEAITAKWDGGLPVGRIMEIAGPPSSGKTAVATAAMAAAQKAGGIAGFNDHERSFSLRLAPKLGLDITPGKFVFKKPKTFEQSLNLCIMASKHVRQNKLIDPDAPICWVFDSLASMVPHSAFYDAKGKEKSPEDRSMHDNTALSRATSAAMPAFAQHCEDLNICAIFLNQVRTKIGIVFGDPTTTPGGESLKFYSSVRIMLSAKKITQGEGSKKEVTGSEITAHVIKNKVARPFKKVSWRFMFQPDGTGKFDAVRSLIDFLVANKWLTMSGARVNWADGKTYFKSVLAKKIEEEDDMDLLIDFLPSDYEAPIVAEGETGE